MNLQETINGFINNGTITIHSESSILDSNSNAVLINYFKGKFSGSVSSQANPDNNTVTCNGILTVNCCNLYCGSSPISFTLNFTQTGSVVSLAITLTISQGYSFSDSFSFLKQRPRDILNSVAVNTLSFVFNASDSSGLSISAGIANSGPFSKLSWFGTTTTLTGKVSFQKIDASTSAPVFDLIGQLANSQNLGFTGNFEVVFAVHLKADVISMAKSSQTNAPVKTFFISSLYLEADLGDKDFSIPVRMPLYAGNGQYLISLGFNSANGLSLASGFNTLSKFIDSSGITLPDGFPLANQLLLKSASLVVNPKTMSFFNFMVKVEFNCSWTLFGGKFKLENISATINMANLSKPKNLGLSMGASFSIGSSHFDVYITLPDKTIQARLVQGSSIDINSLLSNCCPGLTLPGSGNFTVYSLDLAADIPNHNYSFEAAAYGSWSIVTGLTFNSAYFYIEESNGTLVRASFSTQISIGTSTPLLIDLFISENKDSNGTSQWKTLGVGTWKTPLKLTDIFNTLLSTFGLGSISLPESLTNLDLSISSISISYDTSNQTFEFGFTLASAASFSSVIGSHVSPSSQSSNFSSFKLIIGNSSGTKTKKLVLEINPGIHLVDLVDLNGDLPASFNPELKKLIFEIDLNSSSGTSSSRYSFSTSFSNSNTPNDVIIFTGEFSTSTQADGSSKKWFGGSMYSPNGNAINLNDPSFPINMGICDLFIVKTADTDTTKHETTYTLFGADISAHADIDLSSIPVVGDFFIEAKFSFNAIRLVYAKCSDSSKTNIEAAELNNINGYLSLLNIAPIQVAQNTVTNNSSGNVPFPLGFSLQGNLLVGDNEKSIPLHSSIQQGGQNTAVTTTQITPVPPSSSETQNTDSATTASSHSTPSPVGKKYGPLTIQNVSIGMSGGQLNLTFTGGLQLGPLFIEFVGLDFNSSLSAFSPSVSLNGLGFDVSKPPLSVKGLFLQGQVTIPTGMVNGVMQTTSISCYSGELSVTFKEYGMVAMGSYAKLPSGDPSIFIYGFLGAPLGGLPVILMITGVAAGFGYNRNLTLPDITAISSHPLIQPVVPGNSQPNNFDALNLNFMPAQGSFWGAIGIRVESFKMIETFLLLCVRFNHELEIDIIGLANMKFPGPLDVDANTTPQMANIIVGVEARIIPDRGIIAVNGAFQQGSYVYCPDAHITGGFAMLSVLKNQSDGEWQGANEGDFIFTLGGYAPGFIAPSYYPSVSRLELNWQVSNALSITAQFYFATTPIAMMAGGSIHGLFQEGGDFSISVSLLLGADFIMYWHPYHYSAHFYADLHVTASINVDLWLFTIHLSIDLDLNADLQIWGPQFSGYGTVSIHILITFSASVSFGDNVNIVPLLLWSDFLTNCLPASNKILTINISSGLLASQSTAADTSKNTPAVYVVNPKELALICGTAIPIKNFTNATVNNPITITPNFSFGIQPMGKTSADIINSDFSINIYHVTPGTNGNPDVKDDKTSDFILTAITKNMPSAMWNANGNNDTLNINAESTVKNLISGISVVPNTPKKGNSCDITLPNYHVAASFSSKFASSNFNYTIINN